MAVFEVSTQGQLDTAVRALSGGDTLLLAPGTYDKLTLNGKFAQTVTIASANPGDPAVITQLISRGATNVEFKDLKFDYVPGKTGDSPFWIEGGRGITLDGVEIEGHISGQYGVGIGLRIKNTQDVAILNSEISDFRNGLSFTGASNVKVTGNDFRGMSNDSMLIGGVTNFEIAGNDFRGMNSSPSLKHKDAIQFFTGSGSGASRDVVIRNNVIDNPEQSHAIFFTNADANSGNRSTYHRDILVEDNYIRSAHTHGISVNHGDGITIRNNTLVANPDEGNTGRINVPLINVSKLSVDVLIQGNTVASVPTPQNSSWTVTGNDVGPRQLQHWYGDQYGPAASAAGGSTSQPVRTDAPAPAPPAGDDAGSGAQEVESKGLRVAGGQLDDGVRVVVRSLEFARGDTFVFNAFDAGTFLARKGGNPVDVWDGGRAAKANSALDLQELVAASPALGATTQADLLIVSVAQDGDRAEIAFEGLGAAFRAADQPELF